MNDMRIKDGFLLREVAGNYVVIATGEGAFEFNSIVTINEIGAFIWNKITEGKDADAIADAITGEYSVDRTTALKDTNDFINQLKEAKIIEE